MSWQPSADIESLKARARLLQSIRAFFAQRAVLEVQTPAISRAANTDAHIDSIQVQSALSDYPHYLLTSPELPMKRLLAAGIGDCYQIAQVFRDGESGRRHNPEFTLLEWYRLGFSMLDLVAELEQLITQLTDRKLVLQRYSYQDLFAGYLSFDPLTITELELNQYLNADGLWQAKQGVLEKDAALDLLFDQRIASQFAEQQLTTVYHYPASQASLSQLNPTDPRVAERFEVYWGSTELANGFHELQDAKEQLERFQQDNQQRANADRLEMPIDEHFIQALESGLPDCSGVAMGLDRLLMKLLDKQHIKDVLSFDWSRI